MNLRHNTCDAEVVSRSRVTEYAPVVDVGEGYIEIDYVTESVTEETSLYCKGCCREVAFSECHDGEEVCDG